MKIFNSLPRGWSSITVHLLQILLGVAVKYKRGRLDVAGCALRLAALWRQIWQHDVPDRANSRYTRPNQQYLCAQCKSWYCHIPRSERSCRIATLRRILPFITASLFLWFSVPIHAAESG